MKPDSPSENRLKAPICAKWVEAMREAFPDLKVLSVNEGDVQLGEKDTAVYASCRYGASGDLIENERRADKS